MSKVKSAKYGRELLGVGCLNFVKRKIAQGAQVVVVGFEVTGNNQNLKQLPTGIFNANVVVGQDAEIATASFIGGKHGAGRSWPIIFGAYHIRILNRNIR